MTKKNPNYQGTILVAAIVVLLVVIMKMQPGMIVQRETIVHDRSTIVKLESPPLQATEYCSLDVEPEEIPFGETIRGRIVDGRNAECSLYYNIDGGEWMMAATVRTNMFGYYTAVYRPEAYGFYEIIAICGECVTNMEELTVLPPEPDADSDGDGYTDEEEIDAGTNPFDPDSNPGTSPSGDEWDDYCDTECDRIGAFYGTAPMADIAPESCEMFGIEMCDLDGLDYGGAVYWDECCCYRCNVPEDDYLNPPECTAYASSHGYSYDMILPGDCFEFADSHCTSIGSVVSGWDLWLNCCMWNCEEEELPYTCGSSIQCEEGTCPPDYPSCVDVSFPGDPDYYACVCVNEDTGELHDDWKPETGVYHQPWHFI